jgi:hypothetical protein
MYRLTPELGEKSFVIGAQFDIVVPTEDTEKLVRALGHPRVFWLNTGHFGGALVQRPLFRMVRRYLVARFTARCRLSNRAAGADGAHRGDLWL